MKAISRIFIALFAALAIPVYAQVTSIPDPTGTYKCVGSDPFRKVDYNDVPLIVKKTGETYSFNWDFGKQGGIIIGTGELNKNATNVIAAVFWDSADPRSVGVITYKIQANGDFDGNWTIPNQNLIGNESCKKQPNPH